MRIVGFAPLFTMCIETWLHQYSMTLTNVFRLRACSSFLEGFHFGTIHFKDRRSFTNTALIVQAWDLHEQGKLMDLLDPSLGLQSDDLVEARRVVNIALMCLQTCGDKRPNMDRVLTLLQGETVSEVIAPVSAGNTEALYRRRNSTINKGGAESTTTFIEGYNSSFNIDSSRPMSPNLLTNQDGHMTDGTATLELSVLTPR